MTHTDRAEPTSSAPRKGLGRRVLAAYSGPAFSQSFLMGPAISVLQGIYAKFFGLGLEQIALVILVSRLFDAVTDPVIGFLSDRYRARRGTRKPWILAGTALAVVACWFLYVPGGRVTTLSFLSWYLLATLGWTLVEMPYGAWLAELTEDYAERARVASWRSVARFLGLLAFFGLPLVLSPVLGTTEFTPTTLRWAALFAAAVLPVAALVAVFVVPNGSVAARREGATLREALGAVGRNRPLWYFAAMYAIAGLGGGMGWGLVYFYIDGYLGLGKRLAGLLVLSIPVGILAAPAWGALCRRYGKQQSWAVGCAGSAVVSLCYALITPGPLAAWLVMMTLLGINALVVAEAVAGPAMLADVVDYGRWRFGADYAGTYYAFFTMVQKANMGIGAGIGLAVAGLVGFDATLATQTTRGVVGLLLGFSGLPALLYLVAAAMVWRFPIDRRRQSVIVRAIARRARRSRTAAPVAEAVP